MPVWKDTPDNIIGVLHTKGLLRAVHSLGGENDALDVQSLASPAWFIPDSTTLLDQLQAFRRRREHFALVVDEYGTLMRSEEHTSELQSLMRISYAVFCLKKNKQKSTKI